MEVLDRFYLLLHPRPAYVVGAGRYGGKVNFMAASWVTPVAEEPPRVAVAIDVESYTYELLKEYGEYTVNILPLDMLKELYFFGSTSGREVDKVKELGLKIAKGLKVNAPVLENAIGVLECKIVGEFESEDTTLFIGDVLTARAHEEFFDARRGWNFRKVNIPLHNWGKGFYTIGRFVMPK
ncbi:MAG: flavin reductase family protein [Thermoprotei archaeon]|nr:MAG: flavin reductase family protein [Thermoprotei archaeon]